VARSENCGSDTEVDFTIYNNTGKVLKLSDATVWPGVYFCQKGVFPGRPAATLNPGASSQVAAGSTVVGGSEARIGYNTPTGEQLSVQAIAGDGLICQNAVQCTPAAPVPATSALKWESACFQQPQPGRSIYIAGLGPWKQNANQIIWMLQEKGSGCTAPSGGNVGCQGTSGEPSPTRTKPTRPPTTFIPP
jgi:hypothetical protein